MCGIIGYIGSLSGHNYIFDGIKILLNRGYDSVGVCSIKNNSLAINKYASDDTANAYEMLNQHRNEYEFVDGPIISHSRCLSQKTI